MSFATRVAIDRWLAANDGVITRSDAYRLGATPAFVATQLADGTWSRVHRGVFVATVWPAGPRQAHRAALAAAGSGAVVSHLSAAWLWAFTSEAPRRVHLTVPAPRHPQLTSPVVVHRTRLPPDTVTRHGLACTAATTTLVACAGMVPDDELTDLVDRALASRAVRLRELPGDLRSPLSRRRPGVGSLRRNLDARGLVGGPAPSVLESRMARLFRRYRLPVPKAEVVWGPDGRYRLDFAWPERMVAIEVQGAVVHARPHQQRRDAVRRNQLNRAGWTVLEYDWHQVVHTPEVVAAEVLAVYRARPPVTQPADPVTRRPRRHPAPASRLGA